MVNMRHNPVELGGAVYLFIIWLIVDYSAGLDYNYWGIEEGVNYIFGSQHHLSDVNLAFKITYRTRMWLSNILTRHDFSYW